EVSDIGGGPHHGSPVLVAPPPDLDARAERRPVAPNRACEPLADDGNRRTAPLRRPKRPTLADGYAGNGEVDGEHVMEGDAVPPPAGRIHSLDEQLIRARILGEGEAIDRAHADHAGMARDLLLEHAVEGLDLAR